MNPTLRTLVRPLLTFTAILMLLGLMIQPAVPSQAQEATPPAPTADPRATTPPDQPGIAMLDSDQPSAPPAVVPAGMSKQPPQQAAHPQPAASAPATPAQDEPGAAAPQVAPQAQQPPGTFQVNIVASATVHADSLLTYSIYFTNTSSTTYQNVLLDDGIGGGQTYTDCTGISTCPFTYTGDLARPTVVVVSGVNANPFNVRWALGTVAPNKKGKISYTVRVRNDLFPQSGRPATVLGNTVALYRDNDVASNNKLNEDQWGVLVAGPVFYLTKTSNKPVLLERDSISYVITVGNATGPNDKPNGVLRPDAEDAHGTVVFDIVPPQLTNIVPQDGGTLSTVGGETRVTWNLGTLGREQTRQLHFSGTIKDTLTDCAAMVNTLFYATSNELPIDPNSQQHYPIRGQIDTTSYIIRPATVEVLANPHSMKVGEAVEWTITAKNYWNGAMSPVTIKFNLPPAFAYNGNTPPAGVSAGVYNSSENSVTWQNVTLPAKIDFNNPGQLLFKVQSHAGRVIDRNDGVAQITQVPATVPTGCLRAALDSVNVEPLLYAIKTVDKTLVLSGTDVIYTMVLNNIGAQPMNDVSVIDTLPRPRGIFPFIFRNMVAGPQPTSVTSTQVRWDNIAVPAGSANNPGKTTLQFKATARGLPLDCEANGVLPDSAISQARIAYSQQVCLDFPWVVTKTVDRVAVGPRDPNRTLQFTLTYQSRVSQSQSIQPMDQFLLPQQYWYQFKSMTQGPPPLSTTPQNVPGIGDGVIKWAPVPLPGNGTIVYKFQVDLPLNGGVITSGTYCNRGILQPLPADQFNYYVYSRPDACTAVSSIEMRVTKHINRDNVGLGELVTYAIGLENKSDTDVVGQLVVSDTLPVNMIYAGAVTGSLAPTVSTLPNGQQRLRWEGVTVPPRTTTSLVFNARVPALIGSYINTAEVSGGNPLPFFTCESLTGLCPAAIQVKVYNWVTIDAQPTPALAKPGEIVTYTLSLVSNNNIPYQNVVFTDTLPLGFSYLDTLIGPPPAVFSGGRLVWQNQTLPAQDGANAGRLTFVFRARAPQGYGVFRSRVEASSKTGVIPTADNIGRVIIAPPTPALSMFGPRLVELGSTVSFKISLLNPLSSPLTNVTLTDPLPPGFTFTRVESGSPAPTVNGQTLTWNIPTVAAKDSDGLPGSVEIVFYATAPSTEGKATNTVTASGGGAAIDQTYNKVDMIIARLRYVFLPILLNN
jgi:uncharacterized repeat protein (TIGR01451 family)